MKCFKRFVMTAVIVMMGQSIAPAGDVQFQLNEQSEVPIAKTIGLKSEQFIEWGFPMSKRYVGYPGLRRVAPGVYEWCPGEFYLNEWYRKQQPYILAGFNR